MYRHRISGRMRRLAMGGAAAALLGGALAVSTGAGHAAESCVGLDQALRNNLTFIAGQRTDPDALSAARITNRHAVVDLIQQRRQAAGCTADVEADDGAADGNAAGKAHKADKAGQAGNGKARGKVDGNNGNTTGN